MSLFGACSDLGNFRVIADLLAHFNLHRDVWQAFADQIGDPGDDVRLVASLPRSGLVAGCHNSILVGGQQLSPIQATQIGLIWRLARRVTAFQSGAGETVIHGQKAPHRHRGPRPHWPRQV